MRKATLSPLAARRRATHAHVAKSTAITAAGGSGTLLHRKPLPSFSAGKISANEALGTGAAEGTTALAAASTTTALSEDVISMNAAAVPAVTTTSANLSAAQIEAEYLIKRKQPNRSTAKAVATVEENMTLTSHFDVMRKPDSTGDDSIFSHSVHTGPPPRGGAKRRQPSRKGRLTNKYSDVFASENVLYNGQGSVAGHQQHENNTATGVEASSHAPDVVQKQQQQSSSNRNNSSSSKHSRRRKKSTRGLKGSKGNRKDPNSALIADSEYNASTESGSFRSTTSSNSNSNSMVATDKDGKSHDSSNSSGSERRLLRRGVQYSVCAEAPSKTDEVANESCCLQSTLHSNVESYAENNVEKNSVLHEDHFEPSEQTCAVPAIEASLLLLPPTASSFPPTGLTRLPTNNNNTQGRRRLAAAVAAAAAASAVAAVCFGFYSHEGAYKQLQPSTTTISTLFSSDFLSEEYTTPLISRLAALYNQLPRVDQLTHTAFSFNSSNRSHSSSTSVPSAASVEQKFSAACTPGRPPTASAASKTSAERVLSPPPQTTHRPSNQSKLESPQTSTPAEKQHADSIVSTQVLLHTPNHKRAQQQRGRQQQPTKESTTHRGIKRPPPSELQTSSPDTVTQSVVVGKATTSGGRRGVDVVQEKERKHSRVVEEEKAASSAVRKVEERKKRRIEKKRKEKVVRVMGLSELRVETVHAGSGKTPLAKGHTATVHATGSLLKRDGTAAKFWSTKDAGQQPFTWQPGLNQVIAGWDQGVLGMRVGETRKIYIPSHMGYSNSGFAAWGIPPNADLLFEIELLNMQ